MTQIKILLTKAPLNETKPQPNQDLISVDVPQPDRFGGASSPLSEPEVRAQEDCTCYLE